eukprot:Gb_05108 [translate_table: standard]
MQVIFSDTFLDGSQLMCGVSTSPGELPLRACWGNAVNPGWPLPLNLVGAYFNYMGMLAVEGSYDKMEALLNKSIHPVDILLLLAASEGDKPKIEELMRAGADCTVTDAEGRTALDRAADDDIKNMILNFSK